MAPGRALRYVRVVLRPSWKRLVLFAYALSGASALAYQLVWYHYLVDHFGASGTTYLVVLCTFIGGLGLGSLVSRRATSWLTRATPFRDLGLYGLIELALALSVVALIGLTRLPLVGLVGSSPYQPMAVDGLILLVPVVLYHLLKLGLALFAIGVPCFLMGLTYPYLCSLFPEDTRFPSHLYARNTLGACLSIVAAEFLGFPAIGYFGVLVAALAVNLLIALIFIAARPFAEPGVEVRLAPGAPARRRSNYPALLSGFLCGGLEALAFIFIKLTYCSAKGVFALLSFHAIAGIWLAATIVHRLRPRPFVLVLCGWVALGWCVALWFVEPGLGNAFVFWWAGHAPGMPPYWKGMIVSIVYTAFYISVPYACLSLLLPAVCDQKQANGENLSLTYGLNTLAFLAGALVFGWALQYVHPFYAARIFALAAAAGLLLLSLHRWGERMTARAIALPALVLAIGFPLVPSKLAMRLILAAQDGETLAFDSTPQQFVWIRGDQNHQPAALMFDGHSMSGIGGGSQRYMRLMAHVPLLLHPDPRHALLICYGVGNTADAIRMHETIERVDGVDLSMSVFRLWYAFRRSNHDVLEDPRLSLVVDDGRQFLKLTTNRYELVTLEPPPPLKEGVSRLYSREFYQDVLARLSPGGFITQWLPEDIVTPEAVDLIVRTFVDVFPNSFCFVGAARSLILVGCNGPILLEHLKDRLAAEPRVREDLRRFGIEDVGPLLGVILDTPDTLARKWPAGPVIRDGFVSLDAIMISPVQYFGPKEEFTRTKPNLRAERADVRSWIAAQSPALAKSYDRFWKSLPSNPLAPAAMPACYSGITNAPVSK